MKSTISIHQSTLTDLTMESIIIFLSMLTVVLSKHLPPIDKETLMTLPKLTQDNGYPTTEYTVYTKDGYLINIYRMSGKSPVVEDLPIFLMHGIIGSAEDFLRMGPNRSLAYLLVDRGYDVWLGNFRGNQYTSHKSKDKNDVDFWKFCFDEHGKYDIPAMLEKVFEVTQAPKIHFLGYSMGVTSYFVMCNHRPDLAKKIATFVALAPVTSLSGRYKIITQLAVAFNVPRISESLGLTALIYNEPLQRFLVSIFCNTDEMINDLCYNVAFMLAGDDFSQVEWAKSRIIFSKFQPATLKQLVHYGQLALSGNFSAFDWGYEGNMRRYGQSYPPLYDLAKNIAPTALFYGQNDFLAGPQTSERLSRKLKMNNPAVIKKQLSYKKLNHLDFVYSRDVKDIVNRDIINVIPTLREMEKVRNEI